MSDRRPPFLVELAGRVGPAILSATLVLCLLTRQFEPSHGALFAVAAALIGLEYWWRR